MKKLLLLSLFGLVQLFDNNGMEKQENKKEMSGRKYSEEQASQGRDSSTDSEGETTKKKKLEFEKELNKNMRLAQLNVIDKDLNLNEKKNNVLLFVNMFKGFSPTSKKDAFQQISNEQNKQSGKNSIVNVWGDDKSIGGQNLINFISFENKKSPKNKESPKSPKTNQISSFNPNDESVEFK